MFQCLLYQRVRSSSSKSDFLSFEGDGVVYLVPALIKLGTADGIWIERPSVSSNALVCISVAVHRDKAGKLALSPKQKAVFSRWVRPDEISDNPTMIMSVSSFSIKQVGGSSGASFPAGGPRVAPLCVCGGRRGGLSADFSIFLFTECGLKSASRGTNHDVQGRLNGLNCYYCYCRLADAFIQSDLLWVSRIQTQKNRTEESALSSNKPNYNLLQFLLKSYNCLCFLVKV